MPRLHIRGENELLITYRVANKSCYMFYLPSVRISCAPKRRSCTKVCVINPLNSWWVRQKYLIDSFCSHLPRALCHDSSRVTLFDLQNVHGRPTQFLDSRPPNPSQRRTSGPPKCTAASRVYSCGLYMHVPRMSDSKIVEKQKCTFKRVQLYCVEVYVANLYCKFSPLEIFKDSCAFYCTGNVK